MAAPSSAPRAAGSDDGSQAVEGAILRSVTEHAEEWFPEVGPRPTVHLRQLVDRPRALLYAVHLGGSPVPQVLAKVRRDALGDGGGVWAGTRPRLTAAPLPTSEMVALEYAGLQAIEAMIEPGDPSQAAVRPLAHLADEDTILMGYVDATTLRNVLLSHSRLPGRRRSAPPDTGRPWREVGAWLRRYQQAIPASGLPARQTTRDEVVERFTAYEAFLVDRLGRRAVGDGARRGVELAARVLPESLPVVVGHGDFAPRNVFVLPDERIAVFDPMPRWAVPRFEDLSRFLVGTRLLGLQLHTHGAAFSQASMAQREQQLIDGYAGGDDLPLAELRCFQLLVTLDHWSALADTVATGPRGRLRALSGRLAAGYLRRETDRIADLTEGAARGSRPL